MKRSAIKFNVWHVATEHVGKGWNKEACVV